MRRWTLCVAGACAAAVAALASSGPIAGAASARVPSLKLGDLTTYAYGNARSGHDHVDGHISGLSAIPKWDVTFVPHAKVFGAVYGQPLVYDGTVYVGTVGDTVYALNAKTGGILWQVQTGKAVRKVVEDTAPKLNLTCGDLDPIGIVGTPVIDPARGELFVVEQTYVGSSIWQDIRYQLVAVSLSTHRQLWYRDIDPPHANTKATYYIAAELQRPALTLLGSRLYVEFGGLEGDCGTYHGFVVSVPDTPAGPMLTYEIPTKRGGGISAPSGAVVSRAGDLYVAVGNGSSVVAGAYDEADSIIELSPTLHLLGVWAPRDWAKLNARGVDLGATGPITVPDTSFLFAEGKPSGGGSDGALVRTTPLRGIGNGGLVALACPSGTALGADASDVIGKGASARVYLYLPCSDGTEAIVVNTKAFTFTTAWRISSGVPNGSPVVAGGLVWAIDWNNALLYGMSPTTGRVVVRRATDNTVPFATPAVGDGMVFIPTQQGVQAWAAT
jgi:outer membrane protein assembly factor BamB